MFSVPFPTDEALPDARGLVGPEGEHAIGNFLRERGWSLQAARPVQALYRPGRSCTVRYRVRGVAPNGIQRLMTLAAEASNPPSEFAAPAPELSERYALRDPAGRVGPYLVWSFPYDPSLPRLSEAAWGPTVRDRLREAGVPALGVRVSSLRYRPRRRAVFRYGVLLRDKKGFRSETRFGKVAGRAKTRRLHEVTRLLAPYQDSLPFRMVAPLPGADKAPLIFPRMDGESLRDLLTTGEPLPSPNRIARLVGDSAPLLDRIPGLGDGRHHPPVGADRQVGEFLRLLVPECLADIERVMDSPPDAPAAPDSLVHGDLYEAQVFVSGDWSLGLIDLDDLGRGEPAADAANLCAHLLALALSVPKAAQRLVAYRSLVRSCFLRTLEMTPAAFSRWEARSMLMLATGPFRVLYPNWPAEVGRRVRLAARLLDRP